MDWRGREPTTAFGRRDGLNHFIVHSRKKFLQPVLMERDSEQEEHPMKEIDVTRDLREL